MYLWKGFCSRLPRSFEFRTQLPGRYCRSSIGRCVGRVAISDIGARDTLLAGVHALNGHFTEIRAPPSSLRYPSSTPTLSGSAWTTWRRLRHVVPLVLTSASGLAALSLRDSSRFLARTANGARRYLALRSARAGAGAVGPFTARVLGGARSACFPRAGTLLAGAAGTLALVPLARVRGALPHVDVALIALVALLPPGAPGALTLSTSNSARSLLLPRRRRPGARSSRRRTPYPRA
jgi:hypothetical protein